MNVSAMFGSAMRRNARESEKTRWTSEEYCYTLFFLLLNCPSYTFRRRNHLRNEAKPRHLKLDQASGLSRQIAWSSSSACELSHSTWKSMSRAFADEMNLDQFSLRDLAAPTEFPFK
jgi:hypothetical protein